MPLILNELIDSNYLRDSEDNVSGGNELVWDPTQLVSHYLRQYHAYRLTQHNSLRFDPTHT